MRQRHGHLRSGPDESAAQLRAPVAGDQPQGRRLAITDAFGKTRLVGVCLLPRWPAAQAESEPVPGDEEFRIVILKEPPAEPVQPPRATIVCAPTRPLATGAVREATATYETSTPQQPLLLSPQAVELLGQGRLYAPQELEVNPRDVFSAGEARLELLARQLVTLETLAVYSHPLAVALAAPDTPAPATSEQRRRDLEALARPLALSRDEIELEARDALNRLSRLADAPNAEEFLCTAAALYPRPEALADDVYLARALRERPQEALEMLKARRFLAEAIVPANESELALDRAIAREQAHFACLVTEPQRLVTALSALEHFRVHYRQRYLAHHRAYWEEMAELQSRLLEAGPTVQALGRLNSLTELGPPVGEGAVLLFQSLLEETSGCPSAMELGDALAAEALCPGCRLQLDDSAPSEPLAEVLQRIQRACDRQMARLASAAVSQVLAHSGDPRLEQFLKVVQASQLSSLSEILDDDLTGYLRRFLVEARINATLQPIMAQLQKGTTPDKDEARQVMLDIAQVLRRAFRASQRELPPASTPVAEPRPGKRSR